MNLELTDEQVALRDTVRRYLSKNAGVSDHVRTMLDDPRGTTDAVWRGLVDLGTTSLLIPADRGGDGMSMFEAGWCARSWALHCIPVRGCPVRSSRRGH